MKRLFDIVLSVALLIFFSPLMLAVALAVKLTSKGAVLHVSDRVGRNCRLFKMYKFRTMRGGAPQVATHLMRNPGDFLTPVGGFLRRTSLDEIPQLWNILKGEMSFVGPRPALFNQFDLIKLRAEKGVDSLVPGLTGWAQVNGRDDLSIPAKVVHDEHYLRNRSLLLDFGIIAKTFLSVVKRDGIAH